MRLSILVEARGWRMVTDLNKVVEGAVQVVVRQRDVSLTVLLTSDAEMRRLNNLWRGKDKATNVLSFPAAAGLKQRGEPKPLGDIALGYTTIVRESRAQGKSVKDHLTHLLVHGVLHLLGYDHEDDGDARLMERQERRILKGLGIANPYIIED